MLIKKEWGITIAAMAVILGFVTYLEATNVSSTYSSSSANNIGAWYDERWEAVECYQTKKESDTEAVFAMTAIESLPKDNPTMVYNNGIVKVSMPSHTAITKWKVTGHVHFPNN